TVQTIAFQQQNPGNDGKVRVPAVNAANYPNAIDDIFRFELAQIQQKQAYVRGLLVDAGANNLRPRLAAATRPVADYHHGTWQPIAGGATSLGLDLGDTSRRWAADLVSQPEVNPGDTALVQEYREKDKAISWITNSW